MTQQEAGAAEPVAWHTTDIFGRIAQTGNAVDAETWRAQGYTVKPLYAAPPAPQPSLAGEVSDAARDVLTERRRQVSVEGWTPEHDDAHSAGELAKAAGVYALAAASHDYRWVLLGSPVNDYLAATFKMWPWDWSWFKPKTQRRDFVKAAALLLAEIERLDRAALTPSKTE